jgi:K+-transporting ATPase A subunit
MLKPTWTLDLFLKLQQYKRKVAIEDDSKTHKMIFLTSLIYIVLLVITLSFAIPSFFSHL